MNFILGSRWSTVYYSATTFTDTLVRLPARYNTFPLAKFSLNTWSLFLHNTYLFSSSLNILHNYSREELDREPTSAPRKHGETPCMEVMVRGRSGRDRSTLHKSSYTRIRLDVCSSPVPYGRLAGSLDGFTGIRSWPFS